MDTHAVVGGTHDTIVLMVVILQIPKKKESFLALSKWNNTKLKIKIKIKSAYTITLPRIMRIIVIDIEYKGNDHTHLIHPNIWMTFTKHQRKIEINFIDGNVLNLPYYDVDFFAYSSEKKMDL